MKYPRTGFPLFLASTLAATAIFAAPVDPAPTVKRELAAEGQLYTYIDLEGGWKQLAQELQTALAGTEVGKKDFVAVAEATGLASIRALGLSSTATKDGYDNRFFIHTPGGRKGLLAIFPGEPVAFDGAQMAPADTDFFLEMQLDVPAATGAVTQIIRTVSDSKEEADLAIAMLGGETFAYGKLLDFRGRVVTAIRLHSAEAMERARQELSSQIPMDLFYHSTGGGSFARELLSLSRDWQREDQGARIRFTKTSGDGTEILVLVDGEQIAAGFPRAFVEECLARKIGLAQAPAFKQTLAGTAPKGQSVFYATPRALTELRNTALTLAAFTRNPLISTRRQALAFNQLLSAIDIPAKSVASVVVARPDGLLVRSRSPQSFKAALPAVTLLTPDFLGQLFKSMAKVYADSTATQREGEAIRQKISGDLDRVRAVAMKFFAANPEENEIGLAALREKLPEEKIPALAEVQGDIVFSRASDQIVVDLKNGYSVTHVFPLTDAQRRTIEKNLERLALASAECLLAGNNYVTVGTLTDSGFLERIDPVMGESYDSVDFALETQVLKVQTPGGQEISYTRASRQLAEARRRNAERRIAIEKNLARIDAAVKKYLEGNADAMSVSFEKLAELGLVSDVQPVVGENYAEQLYSMTRDDPYREINTPRVGQVRLMRPLDAAVRAELTEKLSELERLVARYFAANPEAEVVVSGELLPVAEQPSEAKREFDDAGRPVQKQPDLTGLVIRRDYTSLRLALENDQFVEVPRSSTRN